MSDSPSDADPQRRVLFSPHQAYAPQLHVLNGPSLPRLVRGLAALLAQPPAGPDWVRLDARFTPGQPVYASLTLRNDARPCQPFILEAATAPAALAGCAAVLRDPALGAVGLRPLADLGAQLPPALAALTGPILTRYQRDGSASLRSREAELALSHPAAAQRVVADARALHEALATGVRVCVPVLHPPGWTAVETGDLLRLDAWCRRAAGDPRIPAAALAETLAAVWTSNAGLLRQTPADARYWQGVAQAQALGKLVPSLADLAARVAERLTAAQAPAALPGRPCLGAPVTSALRGTHDGALAIANSQRAHRDEPEADWASLGLGLARLENVGALQVDSHAVLNATELALRSRGIELDPRRTEFHRLLLLLRLAALQTRSIAPDGHVRARAILRRALREY